MKHEKLFEALTNIGDDLLLMAENMRFPNPWRRWGKLAACIALVLCLGIAALPYFPIGCGAAEESAVTTETAEAVTESTVKEECVEEETAAEEAEDAKEAVTIWLAGKAYELQPGVLEQPGDLGEELGLVEESDGRDLSGCVVYAVQDSDDVYVLAPEGYFYAKYVE